jgi:putative ABC transport system ATP-binding protein/lipoprotein-releasing system ATP-binding protein
VIHGISVAVPSGGVLGLVGPSGSGKTTMLGVLAGTQRLDEGSVVVEDAAGVRHRSSGSCVTWIPQGSNALPARSVVDNVAIAALALGWSRVDARAQAQMLLAEVGLAQRRHDQAGTLSGGELQRLAVARALAANRAFLLADEPTGNLDRRNGLEVMSLLRRAAANGRGVVVATHDLTFAEQCDAVIEMEVR